MAEKIRNHNIVILLILFTILFTFCFQQFFVKDYARYNTENLHYEKGIVVEVSSEDIEYDKDLGIYLGSQNLRIKMLEGSKKNEIIEVTNYLTKTHNVHAGIHTKLIINVDQPENLEPYYTIYNFDRSFSLLCSILVLAAAILCIGGEKV